MNIDMKPIERIMRTASIIPIFCPSPKAATRIGQFGFRFSTHLPTFDDRDIVPLDKLRACLNENGWSCYRAHCSSERFKC